jgi:hypothetical protein
MASGSITCLAALGFLFIGGPARADVVTLTFENVGNGQIGSFYSGGPGGDYGITFDRGAYGLVDADAGGGGFFANEPSPSTVLIFPTTPSRPGYVNVEGGFRKEVALFYTQPSDPNRPDAVFSHFTLAVFNGFDGAGRELGRWSLPSTDAFGPGDPDGGLFGTFAPFTGSFRGTARSLGFFEPRSTTGAAFDNLRFDLAPAAPVPEPTSLLLLAGGAVGLAVRRVWSRAG